MQIKQRGCVPFRFHETEDITIIGDRKGVHNVRDEDRVEGIECPARANSLESQRALKRGTRTHQRVPT